MKTSSLSFILVLVFLIYSVIGRSIEPRDTRCSICLVPGACRCENGVEAISDNEKRCFKKATSIDLDKISSTDISDIKKGFMSIAKLIKKVLKDPKKAILAVAKYDICLIESLGKKKSPITYYDQTEYCGKLDGYNKWVCKSGLCCSKYGYCGVTADHCDRSCQSEFGYCGRVSGGNGSKLGEKRCLRKLPSVKWKRPGETLSLTMDNVNKFCGRSNCQRAYDDESGKSSSARKSDWDSCKSDILYEALYLWIKTNWSVVDSTVNYY